MQEMPKKDGSSAQFESVEWKPEIERKFLILNLPDEIKQAIAEEKYFMKGISQGYIKGLGHGKLKKNIRLREEWTPEKGFRHRRTEKEDTESAFTRAEKELAHDADVFASEWDLTAHARLKKIRVHIPNGEHTIELDVFLGPLKGLVYAEVEFRSEAEAKAFEPPAWFGPDISQKEWRNSKLVKDGVPVKSLKELEKEEGIKWHPMDTSFIARFRDAFKEARKERKTRDDVEE